MQTIGDHPDIVRIERTGYPWGYEEAKPILTCDICGEKLYTDDIYYDVDYYNICSTCKVHTEKYSDGTVYCDGCQKEIKKDGLYYSVEDFNMCEHCMDIRGRLC